MTFFYELKNHFKNDNLCDWFELHHSQYKKDKSSQFHMNLIKEKSEYVTKITDIFNFKYHHLVLRNQNNEQINYHMENNHRYIFLNSKLYSQKYQIYVSPHIIIHRDIFKEIFSEVIEEDLPKYVVFDILYNIISYNSDKTDILNNGNMIYYKCKISLAIDCLQYSDKIYGFFLAKEYRHKNKILSKKKTIGKFPIYDDYYSDIKEGINWLKRLHKKYKQWSIYPEPSVIELYPNMNNKESEWFSEKSKLANKIKEITMIWNISYEKRNSLILENNIKKWDNPILCNYYDLKNNLPSTIKKQMIHINNQSVVDISPRKIKDNQFLSYLNHTNKIILDIESVVYLDENESYFNKIENKEKPKICIIGVIHQVNNEPIFKDFTISYLNNIEEKRIINHWIQYLKKISKSDKIYIYHWGNAEKCYIEYMMDKYPDITFPSIELIDICFYFKQEPIIIRGCFGYGLKEIANKLYEYSKINTIWREDMNGLDAIYYLLEYSKKSEVDNIPIKRYPEIKKIVEYNKMDCLVLYEIIQFIQTL